jgi:hypothetical protein
VTAIAADSTGATPTRTAVRDGPMTPTPRVKKIWLMPGANKPVTKKGHVSLQTRAEKSSRTTANSKQIAPAKTVVTSEPASASNPSARAMLIVTASAPKEAAAPTASRTTTIGAARFELATSASQRQHSDQAELRPAAVRLHL